jgi:hypothetical protein
MIFTRPRASPPIDGRLGDPRSSATYATRDTTLGGRVLVRSHCCSSYRVAHSFSSLGTFSSSFIRNPVFNPIDDCEHPLLYLPGTGIVSQEIAVSGSKGKIYLTCFIYYMLSKGISYYRQPTNVYILMSYALNQNKLKKKILYYSFIHLFIQSFIQHLSNN